MWINSLTDSYNDAYLTHIHVTDGRRTRDGWALIAHTHNGQEVDLFCGTEDECQSVEEALKQAWIDRAPSFCALPDD